MIFSNRKQRSFQAKIVFSDRGSVVDFVMTLKDSPVLLPIWLKKKNVVVVTDMQVYLTKPCVCKNLNSGFVFGHFEISFKAINQLKALSIRELIDTAKP